MSIIKFKKYSIQDINTIVFELKNLKAAIVDTDTIFGIISANLNLIYKIKERATSKKIVAFVGDKEIIPNLNPKQKEFLDKFWPGGVTIVKDAISYRMPNDQFILDLLKHFNVLYCSSANISNQDVIQNIDETNHVFSAEKYYYDLFLIDYVNQNKTNIQSTVVDIDKWQILREGYKSDEIQEFINDIESKYKVWI